MSTPETSIGNILRNVRCKNDPPEESQLCGGPLLEEIVKLAAMTAGYYLAKTAGASYVAPYTEVRTKADLRQLMQFACKDQTERYAAIFCTDMLGGSSFEGRFSVENSQSLYACLWPIAGINQLGASFS